MNLKTILTVAAASFGLNAGAALFTPGEIKTFSPNGEGDWTLATSTTYTYDSEGRRLTETQANGWRYEYTYTEAGMMESRTSLIPAGTLFANQYRNVYKYDEKAPTFQISDSSEQWGDGKWNVLGITELAVTRNNAGTVERVTLSMIYDMESGREPDMPLYSVTYGSDGIANSIIVYEESYGETPAEAYRFDNIVWENTDGQILLSETGIQNHELYSGANRIKSATVRGLADNDISLEVTYSGESDYAMTATLNGDMVVKQAYSLLDENGSYDFYKKQTIFFNGQTGVYQESRDEKMYDSFGIMTESSVLTVFQYAEGQEPYGGTVYTKADVTYNAETGLPEEAIESRSENGTDWNLSTKRVYSNYPANGLTTIQADAGPAEYYNLAGLRVTNPAQGIFIRLQGGKAEKVIIR